MSYVKCRKCGNDYVIEDSNPNVHYDPNPECPHCKRPDAAGGTAKGMELTVPQALVVVQRGWTTPAEKELVDIAQARLNREARKLHLEYQKQKIEQELKSDPYDQ